MDKGDILWQIAHGETPDNIKNHPGAERAQHPADRSSRASPARSSPRRWSSRANRAVTTTPQGRGAMLRAYDKATGKEVGAVFMPSQQSGSPMTYMLNGKQYIVVAIGGGTFPGEYIVRTSLRRVVITTVDTEDTEVAT